METQSSSLTQEQRDRMMESRRLALARLKSKQFPVTAAAVVPDWGARVSHRDVEMGENHEEGAQGVSGEKPVTLSDEQIKVLEAVAQGASVFVTGSAGTGKSYVVEYAVKVLKLLHGPGAVFVTASTGIAACAVGGSTLHSFAGVGLGEGRREELASMVISSREKMKKWIVAKALVIDEISMIDAELFDKIDYVGRVARDCDKPFGGLQLVVTGDFFQLPPVQRGGEIKRFSFDASCWSACFDLQIELTQVFRQSDRQFIDLLNEVRRGRCSLETVRRLQACSLTPESFSTSLGVIQPTKLFPRREDVERVNAQKLGELNTERITFYARDEGRTQLLSGCRAEAQVTLAVGAQVMLLKNLDTNKGLVNGARGILISFQPLPDDQEDATNITSRTGGWPIVRFVGRGGECFLQVLRPESWSVMEGEREVAKRAQVPLVLAWALSIHKCQGMTLDCVETDLSRSFEYGMVYVALSRVRSLAGLRLLGFQPHKIKAHSQVVGFYDQLRSKTKVIFA